ncbi:MAG: hypothetical protein IT325_06350 [Anaerolineae bacterium]|nr:hypothetical protein [Anaerolineae bacterium]
MRKIERGAGRGALIALLALIVGGLLLAPLRATAQDDAGAITFTRATVVFPAAIQFVIGVEAAPDAIARATLTVSQAGETLRVFEIDDMRAAVLNSDDAFAELVITWTLDAPPYPRLFAPLDYAWTVETDSGARSSASAALDYADPRFTWQVAGAPPLTLRWHHARLNGAGIRAELEPVLDALREQTGQAPEFEFVIYDPDAPLCPPADAVSPLNEQAFDCSAAQHARAYENAGAIFMQRPSLGFSELRDQLAARMARETYTRWWDEAGADVPAWFAAGLAALYRPRGDLAALELVRAALRDEALLPDQALARALPPDAAPAERALWQAQSAVLVRYLADRSGPDAPFEVARALAAGAAFDAALAALDDTLPAGLWDGWTQWAASDQAGRAAAQTLYRPVAVAPTATPTIAPGATSTATRTPDLQPSRTPSPAPSLTPTLLGNVAPQVIVMQAPPTQRLAPTSTPLPPGSLPSVTPRAVSSPPVPARAEAPLDRAATLGVVLLASGGALLLIALGLLLRR